MATITIDGKEYDVETLSEETKAQLGSLQYVDSELARLQAQAAALQTARMAYGRAVKQILEEGEAPEEDEVSVEGLGESLQFDNL
jgi:cell division protein ZapA (FtsZ GTPase activity inhibitor)